MSDAENDAQLVRELLDRSRLLEPTAFNTLRDGICREGWKRQQQRPDYNSFARLLDDIRALPFGELCVVQGFVLALHNERIERSEGKQA